MSTSENTNIPSLQPLRVFLFSGKRKSGKDFLTERFLDLCNEARVETVIIRLSGPLKKCYAQNHDLDYQELLGTSEYKEKHRLNMIQWSEEIRNKDYGYFCRAAIEMYDAGKFKVWIVSDCRRKTDLRFFEENFGNACKRVRVYASDATRSARGFTFQTGVDDAESECGLDDVDKFDYFIENEGEESAEQLLEPLVNDIKQLQSLDGN